VLNALVVTGSFFYEPDLAPDGVGDLPNSVTYLTNGEMGDASDLWFSMPEVYIDGQLVPLPIFVEPPMLPAANVARIGLADETFGGSDTVQYFRSKFETLLPFPDTRDYNVSVDLSKGPTDPNIIDSLLLTDAFEVTDFTDVNGFEHVQARQTNPETESPTYEFVADFDLSLFAVPEPSLSAGLAAGWFGVLALARLRRRTGRR
jgi:hypothetical protein